MKAQVMLKIVGFCLTAVMVAACWGTTLCAQEKPKALLSLQNAGVEQKEQVPDTLKSAEKLGGGETEPGDVEPAEAAFTPNQTVTLVRMDGERISGRLVSVDWGQSLLTVGFRFGGRKTYSISEIEKVEYRKAGRVKPGWVMAGFLGGVLIGGFIARESVSSCNGFECIGEEIVQPLRGFTFILTGGCIGAGLGVLISKASSSKTYTIEFNQ